MNTTNSVLQSFSAEGGDVIAQEKFHYACGTIVTDIITPLMNHVMKEVEFLDPEGATIVHNYMLERAQIYTNDLYATLSKDKNIDSTSGKSHMNRALAKEASIMEGKQRLKDMIGFFPILKLLECILENARDYKTFIQFDGNIIDTPSKLGKFVSSFLMKRYDFLGEAFDINGENFNIPVRLEHIIKTAKKYDTRILIKRDPEIDSTFCAL